MTAREWVLLDSDGRDGEVAAILSHDTATCVIYPAEDGMGGINWFVGFGYPAPLWESESTRDWPEIESVLPRSEWPSRVFAGQKYEGEHRASDELEAHLAQIEARYAKELADG